MTILALLLAAQAATPPAPKPEDELVPAIVAIERKIPRGSVPIVATVTPPCARALGKAVLAAGAFFDVPVADQRPDAREQVVALVRAAEKECHLPGARP